MPSTSMGVPRMPLVLVPLTEGEKQSDATLMTSKGVVFGNRSDFKMNTSIVHESGTLYAITILFNLILLLPFCFLFFF